MHLWGVDRLKSEARVVRKGAGGRKDPFRYQEVQGGWPAARGCAPAAPTDEVAICCLTRETAFAFLTKIAAGNLKHRRHTVSWKWMSYSVLRHLEGRAGSATHLPASDEKKSPPREPPLRCREGLGYAFADCLQQSGDQTCCLEHQLSLSPRKRKAPL
jgi:hypothetical protein